MKSRTANTFKKKRFTFCTMIRSDHRSENLAQKYDTFRSVSWKVCKNWYVQSSDLNTPGHGDKTA